MSYDSNETAEQFTHINTVEATASGTGEAFIAVRELSADWLREATVTLTHLRQLKTNWDSYGAAPVDDVAIRYACQFLHRVALVQGIEPPYITATPNGQVGLCWNDEQRSMELEVDGSGRFSYYYESGDSEEESKTVDAAVVIELLSRV